MFARLYPYHQWLTCSSFSRFSEVGTKRKNESCSCDSSMDHHENSTVRPSIESRQYEYGLTRNGDEEKESPILSCLRGQKQGGKDEDPTLLECPTQHSISTLGSSLGDDECNDWNDIDDDTFASFSIDDDEGIFENYDPLLDETLLNSLPISASNHRPEHQNNKEKFIIENGIDDVIHVAYVEGDDGHQSRQEYPSYLDNGRCMASENHMIPELPVHHSIAPLYNDDYSIMDDGAASMADSMISLNDAFERLNDCMNRTAQSYKVLEALAARPCPAVTPSTSGNAKTASGAQTGTPIYSTTFHLSGGSSCSSSTSLCSSSTSLSSVGSKSDRSVMKGPRMKAKRKRARKKSGTLSRSGVAPRTMQAFLC